MQRIMTLKTEQRTWTIERFLEDWQTSLQNHDHAVKDSERVGPVSS